MSAATVRSISHPRFASLLIRLVARGGPLAAGLVLASSAAAQTGATVRGVLLDPDGRRVPGARVLVVSRAAAIATATADETGTFEARNLPPGRAELHVAADGLHADPVAVDLEAGAVREVTIALRLGAVREALVVSAAQVELPLTRTPASTTIVTAEDLRLFQRETVAEALRSVPGLAVARSGGRGALTSLFPRGGESDYTLVLVDGVPINAFGGGFDFGSLLAGDVERLEIVRGPQSALFGGGAIGSVVQIVTAPAPGRSRLDLLAEAGSAATWRTAAGGALATGPFAVTLSAERAA
ncbi:MAG TPA: TonB-dependent receptor plug domain-containing protein, partial [Vicinamibacterales bacterium]|nr:TonB-dependent receptor plug domain-containing protein [Vicinamibacterales bacterium]